MEQEEAQELTSTEKKNAARLIPDPTVPAKTLKEQIENNLIIFFLGTLLTGFLAGMGVYKGILTIAELETINKKDKSEYELLKKNPMVQTGTTIERVSPPIDLSLNVMGSKPAWLEVQVNLLGIEGSYKQSKATEVNAELHYGADAVQYEFAQSFKEFDWTLNAIDPYQITGQGYLVNSTNDLIQPLKFSISESNDKVTFHVPESNKGDKLIAVIRIESEKPLQLKDITAALHSSSK